jgi:hypothetical protein
VTAALPALLAGGKPLVAGTRVAAKESKKLYANMAFNLLIKIPLVSFFVVLKGMLCRGSRYTVCAAWCSAMLYYVAGAVNQRCVRKRKIDTVKQGQIDR